MNSHEIISNIEQSIEYLQRFEKNQRRINYGDWEERFRKETDKLVDQNNKLSSTVLRISSVCKYLYLIAQA